MQLVKSYFELIKLLLSKKLIFCYATVGIGIQSITIRVFLNYCVIHDKKVLFINCDDWLLKFFNKHLTYNSEIFELKGEHILSGYKFINFAFSFIFFIYSIFFYMLKFIKLNKSSRRKLLYSRIVNLMKIMEYKCNNRFDILINTNNHNTSYMLEKLGISKDDWYVCLHVRDHLFYQSYKGNALRNSNIENYGAAVEQIANAGGKILRLGSPSSKNYSKIYTHKDLIDYPNSKVKSDYLDLYLIKNCEFYLGTTSGPMDVAELFNKNILSANIYPDTFNYFYHNKCLGILKHIKFNKQKIRISDSFEYYEHFFNKPWNSDDNDNIKFVENTPDEILQLVLDYLDRKKRNDFKLSSLQTEYNNKLINCIKEMKCLNESYFYNLLYAKLNLSLHGSISHSFLEKNW